MQRYPVSRAFLVVVLSVLVISGTAGLATLFWAKLHDEWQHDPAYRITVLLQKTPHRELLDTRYLAELIGLSADHPSNLYAFDSKKGEKSLLKNPLFKKASLRKRRPGTLEVNYELYLPIALLGDQTNTAVTKEGLFIPVYPFFETASLPLLYSGERGPWGASLSKEKQQQLHALFHALKPFGHLKSLDISNANGRKEYVVLLSTPSLHCLRLPVQEWEKALADYLLLWKNLKKENVTIDLRIKGMALIK